MGHRSVDGSVSEHHDVLPQEGSKEKNISKCPKRLSQKRQPGLDSVVWFVHFYADL